VEEELPVDPYAAPGYSPELGGLISGGALFSFSLDPEDPTLPRSSIPVSASFTTSGSVIFAVTPSFYLPHDKVRIFGTLLLKNLNDNFWGVGYDAGVSPSAPDETTQYQRVWWQVAPRVVFQVAKDLFVGPVLDLNQTIASDMPPEMSSEPHVVEDGTNNYNGGAGGIIQYDTRDFPQNAFRGVLLEARVTGYGPWLGSDNLYMQVALDYRHTSRSGARRKHALNVHVGAVIGDAPWSELPSVGGVYDLRGYYTGRFRDVRATWALLEYRYMLPTKNPDRDYSRSGFVGWGGTGFLGTEGFRNSSLLPNAGVGYRFGSTAMNARLDRVRRGWIPGASSASWKHRVRRRRRPDAADRLGGLVVDLDAVMDRVPCHRLLPGGRDRFMSGAAPRRECRASVPCATDRHQPVSGRRRSRTDRARRSRDPSSTFGSGDPNTATWRCAMGCDPSGGLLSRPSPGRGRRVVELDAVRVALLREEELAALAVVLLGGVARDDRVEVRGVAVSVGALLRAQDPPEALRFLLAAPPRAGDPDRDVRIRDVDREVPDLRHGEHGRLSRAKALVERVAFRLRRRP
jgi:hypothetical protein